MRTVKTTTIPEKIVGKGPLERVKASIQKAYDACDLLVYGQLLSNTSEWVERKGGGWYVGEYFVDTQGSVIRITQTWTVPLKF